MSGPAFSTPPPQRPIHSWRRQCITVIYRLNWPPSCHAPMQSDYWVPPPDRSLGILLTRRIRLIFDLLSEQLRNWFHVVTAVIVYRTDVHKFRFPWHFNQIFCTTKNPTVNDQWSSVCVVARLMLCDLLASFRSEWGLRHRTAPSAND